MTRANRGNRSWSRIEGRLLGAALQSLVSHANTQDRYSCNKSVTGDNVDIYHNMIWYQYISHTNTHDLYSCIQRCNEARIWSDLLSFRYSQAKVFGSQSPIVVTHFYWYIFWSNTGHHDIIIIFCYHKANAYRRQETQLVCYQNVAISQLSENRNDTKSIMIMIVNHWWWICTEAVWRMLLSHWKKLNALGFPGSQFHFWCWWWRWW